MTYFHLFFENTVFLIPSGIPAELDDSDLEEARRSAVGFMEEEDPFEVSSADPRKRAAADPGSLYHKAPMRIKEADLIILKNRFPRLKEFSDEFLQARSMEELLKIESASIKIREAERKGDVEDKLAVNKQNLESSAVNVEAGLDNRWTVLHPARFLAGAACSTKRIWLAARASIDSQGHSPVANYDLSSVGLGGFVTSRGWLELANPGSTKISLRLFNINNVGSKASKATASGLEDVEDIAELGEFKLALRTLRTAAQFACPWNFSFLALEGFLIQNDFFMSELNGTVNPAITLSQFVDYILHENANRWRDADGFISAGELKAYWSSFSSARPKVLLKKKEQGAAQSTSAFSQKQNPMASKTKQSGFHSLPRHAARINLPFTDACRLWNTGKCLKAAGTCTTSKGVPLRHVCNFSDLNNPSANVCGQIHQSYMNH